MIIESNNVLFTIMAKCGKVEQICISRITILKEEVYSCLYLEGI